MYILVHKTNKDETASIITSEEQTDRVHKLLIEKLQNARKYCGEFDPEAYAEVILTNLENLLKHIGGHKSAFGHKLAELITSDGADFSEELRLQMLDHNLVSGSKRGLAHICAKLMENKDVKIYMKALREWPDSCQDDLDEALSKPLRLLIVYDNSPENFELSYAKVKVIARKVSCKLAQEILDEEFRDLNFDKATPELINRLKIIKYIVKSRGVLQDEEDKDKQW